LFFKYNRLKSENTEFLLTSSHQVFNLIYNTLIKEFDMNIFVGNLAKDVTDEDLNQEFSAYGKVKSAKVIRDLFSGDSKGFGFVEMPAAAEAQEAIQALNTKDVKGKKLTVNEARPKPEGGRRSGGGGGRGGNFRSGGNGGGGRRW
jgi:RNA recognition motif-containing protein